ncbi:MAG: toprim domain-containing protein [Desulfobulbaceae bacterium]|nr:toprim domain-containing protein [Desulfobulbaceae bacterium]
MKTNTTTSKGFSFPADFRGLDDLIWRLKYEASYTVVAEYLDTLCDVLQELHCLRDGLSQLRYGRTGKSEQEIDVFLDLLRGVKAGGAMNNDFATLKERIDLAAYISGRTGHQTTQVGTDTLDLAACPFCEGHDCFRITPSKKSYYCFQCKPDQAGGDVYDFVQRLDQCDKAEALRRLAEEHGYPLSNPDPAAPGCTLEEEKALEGRKSIFEEAASYYHARLMSDGRALGYQKKVRRHAEETLAAFRVGYTDGRLYEHLKARGYSDDQLVCSGLVKLRDGRLTDFFVHDLFIYPHLAKDGQVAGFTIKDQRKKYKYRLPGEYWAKGCLFHNMQAFNGKEVVLVEGENDLLSVHGRGGVLHVAAINGQVSREQLDYLAEWAPGKTIYLCFDNDQAGQAYTDKVCQTLNNLCLPKTMIRLMKENSTMVRIIRFDHETKDVDEYLRGQNEPAVAMAALLSGAEQYFPPLKRLKKLYQEWARKTDESDQERAFNFDTYGNICFEWFQARGKFFFDGSESQLFFRNRIYAIGNNIPFKALLYDQAGINTATNGARLVIQTLESQAFLKGSRISSPGWIFTNFKENTVYFNLCGEDSTLLKIAPGKIELVANGTNTEQVLLKNSPKMHPIRYMPDADIGKGMARLKELVFDNLTCDLADRYFIVCLLINVVLLQYAKARGIAKFSGPSSSSKTSAAVLESVLIYGEDYVTSSTAAADFSDAAVSPLSFSDNLETDAVRGGKRDFLLTASTGVTRQKRKAGSDSDNVYERACSQLVVTAVEPFTDHEMISRSIEIIFDKKFQNPSFKGMVAIEAEIKEARDLVLSTIFKIVSHNVLPNIEQKKADTLKMINNDYPKHSKERLNELYAMLYLILREVVKYISQPGHQADPAEARWIFDQWIVNQNHRAFATSAETNRVLFALEALLREYQLRPDGFNSAYGIEVAESGGTEGQTVFVATTGELFLALNYLAKERGVANPYTNASQLGARISDSLEVLKGAGWEFKQHATARQGKRRHHFVKTFAG